jgi:hypothetical protein
MPIKLPEEGTPEFEDFMKAATEYMDGELRKPAPWETREGEIKMWISEKSLDYYTYPIIQALFKRLIADGQIETRGNPDDHMFFLLDRYGPQLTFNMWQLVNREQREKLKERDEAAAQGKTQEPVK